MQATFEHRSDTYCGRCERLENVIGEWEVSVSYFFDVRNNFNMFLRDDFLETTEIWAAGRISFLCLPGRFMEEGDYSE